MWRIKHMWMVIWLVNIKLINSSGKLSIRFLRFKNSKNEVNNGECCDNTIWCVDACDIYLKICVTEVSQIKCNADTFQTKVLGDETSFSFPGIGGDLGNGKSNPLEYTFQKWQGFSLALELWDYDSGFIKGSSDFVDSLHLDIKDAPDQNSTSASSKEKPMRSKSSPNERFIDVEIKVYCDDNYLVPDCARYCIPRDDASGHYTCDYVRGSVVCRPHWHGDRCTQYCKPRNDGFGNYTCDKNGAKICAQNWYGGNCSTFCKNTNGMTGRYKCDPSTGDKVCLPGWYGDDCLVFCKSHDSTDGRFSCNKTSGEKVCLEDWYGANCNKYCSPQNERLLGHYTCDVIGNRVCLPGWHGANCTQAMTTLIITCCNKLELWVDGMWYGPDNCQWNIPWSFQISSNATLIAVKGVQFGTKGGILGSLSNGLVTDEAWKCTERFHSDWMKLTYDDSAWSRAKAHGYNGANAWGKVPGIADNANWIWTADNKNDDVVYCRRTLTEIAPTAAPKSPKAIQGSYETPLLNPVSQSTHPHARQQTRPVKPTVITSSTLETFPSVYPTVSSSWDIIKLNFSKQNNALRISPLLRTSQRFSGIHPFQTTAKKEQETTIQLHKTRTLNEYGLKTSTLRPFRKAQTFPHSERKASVTETIITFTEGPKVQKPTKTTQTYANRSDSIKSQISLAISWHSYDASDRNYQSKSMTENGITKASITETLATRDTLFPSKTYINFSNSKNSSKISPNLLPQTSTQKQLYHLTSSIQLSPTTYRRDKTKVTMNTKDLMVSNPRITRSDGTYRGPVPPTRSAVMMSFSTQVLLAESQVMTSLSSTVAMNDGKHSKKDTFAFVFFPPVAFMTAVGLLICIRMKQRKIKVSPVSTGQQLQRQDNSVQSPRIFVIPQSQSRQELLQMDVLSTKKRCSGLMSYNQSNHR